MAGVLRPAGVTGPCARVPRFGEAVPRPVAKGYPDRARVEDSGTWARHTQTRQGRLDQAKAIWIGPGVSRLGEKCAERATGTTYSRIGQRIPGLGTKGIWTSARTLVSNPDQPQKFTKCNNLSRDGRTRPEPKVGNSCQCWSTGKRISRARQNGRELSGPMRAVSKARTVRRFRHPDPVAICTWPKNVHWAKVKVAELTVRN